MPSRVLQLTQRTRRLCAVANCKTLESHVYVLLDPVGSAAEPHGIYSPSLHASDCVPNAADVREETE